MSTFNCVTSARNSEASCEEGELVVEREDLWPVPEAASVPSAIGALLALPLIGSGTGWAVAIVPLQPFLRATGSYGWPVDDAG